MHRFSGNRRYSPVAHTSMVSRCAISAKTQRYMGTTGSLPNATVICAHIALSVIAVLSWRNVVSSGGKVWQGRGCIDDYLVFSRLTHPRCPLRSGDRAPTAHRTASDHPVCRGTLGGYGA